MYPKRGYVILRAYKGSGAGWIKQTGEKWELKVNTLLPNQRFRIYACLKDEAAHCSDVQTNSAGEGFCIISDKSESPVILLINETLDTVLSTPCEDIETFLWLAKKDIEAEKQAVPKDEIPMLKQRPELPPNKDEMIAMPMRQEDSTPVDETQKEDNCEKVLLDRPANTLSQSKNHYLENTEALSNEQVQPDISIANKTNASYQIVKKSVRYRSRIIHGLKQTRSNKAYAVFRPESEGKPLDALPLLSWPDAAREFRYYFENHLPNAVLSGQDWRYVELARNNESSRILGRHIKNERVDRVMIARAAESMRSDTSNDETVLSGRDGRVYIARFYDV